MAFPMFPAVVIVLGLFSALEVSAQTQSASKLPSSQQPVYTLHTDKRVVLTDVTVTDRHGNPIQGMNASDFEVSDNGKKQDLASFEEHSGPPVELGTATQTKPGVYSNDFLNHPPPVFNVLLIDLVSLRELPDQMALYYDLTQFLKHHQAGEPLAVYMRWGPYLMLLQDFTSDQELLFAAVNRALPRFQSHESRVLSEIGMIHELAVDLGKFPGRKNVFWFCGKIGGSAFRPDPTTLNGYANLRVNYDELEAARIAMFPIDARGLMVELPGGYQSVWYGHIMMTSVAEATGGHAVYNENFVGEAAEHLIDASNDFYTLSYSPQNFRRDNSWHKVKITVKAKTYILSYRRGYFADGNDNRNKAEDPQPARSRAKLLPNGEVAEVKDVRGPAIVFQASVLPASGTSQTPAKKGTIPYTIRYTLPLDKFVMRDVDGKQQASMGIASMAFDGNGRSTAKLTQQVTATFTREELKVNGKPAYAFEQPINLKDGENYLYLGVWDVNTGQFGTIQLSLDAKRAKSVHKEVEN